MAYAPKTDAQWNTERDIVINLKGGEIPRTPPRIVPLRKVGDVVYFCHKDCLIVGFEPGSKVLGSKVLLAYTDDHGVIHTLAVSSDAV
jgi:hypothetical protein